MNIDEPLYGCRIEELERDLYARGAGHILANDGQRKRLQPPNLQHLCDRRQRGEPCMSEACVETPVRRIESLMKQSCVLIRDEPQGSDPDARVIRQQKPAAMASEARFTVPVDDAS